MAETVPMDFLTRQQERLLEEMGRQRDDTTVLLAFVQRLDGTMQGLVNEVRALHDGHVMRRCKT